MTAAVPMVELWRGPFLESVHNGHAVICDEAGQIVQAWGDPEQVILPRSSSKMIQALPLIESGAADAFGLTVEQLALSCASHQGAAIHTDRVQTWLGDLGLSDADLRCGPQMPNDHLARVALIKSDGGSCQYHNNCSGKHCGFLTLSKHLGAGPEYIDPEHPVQIAAKDAYESVTGMSSPGFGIDGCSAPNYATSVRGLARAMSYFASADETSMRGKAARRLVQAIVTHPDLVAGETRACTELMQAMGGRVAIKTGAEGVFVAIIPDQKIGVALKISDGTTRAADCAIAAILVKLGVLDANHPATLKRLNAPILNRRGVDTGVMRVADGFV